MTAVLPDAPLRGSANLRRNLPVARALRRAALAFAVCFCAVRGVALAADFDAALESLIPKLAAAEVGDRYSAQMQLQAIAAAASRPGAEADRAALGKRLAAKAADASVPQPARAWLVRQLEYMGGAEAVPALAALLAGEDADLRDSARRALEKNPAPEAGAALREALEKAGEPSLKLGLIHSLGIRRDAQAVPLLARQTTPPAADAARLALGRIGTREAVDALLAAPASQATTEGLVAAANQRLADGDAATARTVFANLFSAVQPPGTRAAALFGLAQADPSRLSALIVQGLNSGERQLRLAALNAALTAGARGQDALARSMPQLNTEARLAALRVLDAGAEKQIVTAAGSAEETVRVAALEALGRVGGTASVSVLLTAAATGAGAERAAAATALTRINGPGAAAILERNARDGDLATRAAAVIALGARRQTSALPAIVRLIGDPDPALRAAALAAVGRMGGDAEIEPLAQAVLHGGSDEAVTALTAVAERIADKPAAARKLLALAADREEHLRRLAEAFAALGGAESLGALSRLAGGGNLEARAVAITALAGSGDLAAARALLNVAGYPALTAELQSSALQGAARVVRAAEAAPPADRGEVALAILAAAKTPSDRKAALGALGSVPDARAATTLSGLLTDAEVKKEAGAAALALAGLLRNTDRAAARELARAVQAADLSPELTAQAQRLMR